MKIENPILRKHIAAWTQLRNEIFKSIEGSNNLWLYPDERYELLVKKTVASLTGVDLENEEFVERMKLALDKISKGFAEGIRLTDLKDEYELCAYSLVYGVRSVASVQVAMLEYFLDQSASYMDKEIKILDLGSGTGATMFGIISFFNRFAQYFKWLRNKIKRISIECVDDNGLCGIFLEEMKFHIEKDKDLNQHFQISININVPCKIEDFVSAKEDDYDFIVASKALSEMECVQSDFLNWAKYHEVLDSIFKRTKEEGVFILIESPGGPVRKSMISKTVQLAEERNRFIYSPCVSGCKKNECWGWRVYKYLEPEKWRKLKLVDRLMEKFYLLLISDTDHHISHDIIGLFDHPGIGVHKFCGMFDPRMETCLSEKFCNITCDELDRGRFVFSDESNSKWLFGMDFNNYWEKPKT